ncbi:hypothetical protein HZC34_05500 [Candidatus Saganbacteria bacterium]|nr:hypothetical protein [Candidatus Saganbacteria bacterium]
MNAKLIKREIIKEIEILPINELKSVADFVEFIREKQEEESLLKNKKLLREIKKAKKDWASKKHDQFIEWGTLKKKFSI